MGHRKQTQLKYRLVEEQRWRCCYCLCEVTMSSSKKKKPHYATFEHVDPKKNYYIRTQVHANGFQKEYDPRHDSYENAVIACARCNRLRGHLDPYIFHDQELWRPENAWRLRLHMLQQSFVQYGSMRTLKKMKTCYQRPNPYIQRYSMGENHK